MANKELMINRNYKDTVFRMLFRDKKSLLSLYNALNGSDYEDESALEIVTLEHALFLRMRNDDYSGRSAHALKRVQRTGIAV